ncbi:MAG: hypothetical protein PWQ09_1691, partial [Candidatus Cloacimonadota bacterium]|nr:hypothetical protein [Candidatus Cloacimonadota bacterium]
WSKDNYLHQAEMHKSHMASDPGKYQSS